ncbi:MAG: lipid II flippase MurJ [Acidimicrobiia bacterium]
MTGPEVWRGLGAGALGPTVTTLIAAALVRLGGLGRQIVVARVFGVSTELDVYLASAVVPVFVGNVLGAALNSVVLPHLVRVRHAAGIEAAARSFVHALKVSLLVSVMASLVLAAMAPTLVRGVAPYLASDPRSVGTARWAGLLVVVVVVTQVLTAAAISRRRFLVSALAPLATPLSVAVFALAGGPSPERLMIGTVMGNIVTCTVLAGFLVRDGAFERHGLGELQRFPWWEAIAMMTSIAASGAAVGIDRALAARIEPGALSIVELGTRVPESLESLLAVVVANVGAGGLARWSVQYSIADFKKRAIRLAAAVGSFALPPVVLLVWLSHEVVRLLFEGGRFSANAIDEVVNVQRPALARIPFYLVALLLARALNASRRSWSVARIMAVFAIVSVAGDLVLIPRLGVSGIAWATTGAYAAVVGLFVIAVARPQLARRV